MSLINRVLRISPALAVAMVLSAVTGPGTVLAASPITFGYDGTEGIALGGKCVFGHAAANSNAVLTWRSATSTLKVNTSFVTSQYGSWSYCDPTAVVDVGDVLKLNDSHAQRSLTIPRLTLKVDRANDVFRGQAPPNSDLTVWQWCCFSDYYAHEDLVANSEGRWILDDGDDVPGGTDSYLDWHSPQGDIVTVHSGSPEIDVIVGRSQFRGSATPRIEFKVTLRDGLTNAIKGASTSVADEYGGVSGQFNDANGHPVTVAVGDHIVGRNLATDLDWIVPDASVLASVPDDTVEGSCADAGNLSETAVVKVHRTGHTRGFSIAYVEENGDWFVDFGRHAGFLYDPANIKHGDRIVVECWLDTGDKVTQSFLVP
jgi:hypothetical protein